MAGRILTAARRTEDVDAALRPKTLDEFVEACGDEVQVRRIKVDYASHTPHIEAIHDDLLALPLREAREQFERAYLQQQLLLCNGKVGQLAKRVGMERTHLYRKLRSLGLDFRSIAED